MRSWLLFFDMVCVVAVWSQVVRGLLYFYDDTVEVTCLCIVYMRYPSNRAPNRTHWEDSKQTLSLRCMNVHISHHRSELNRRGQVQVIEKGVVKWCDY